jgi:hypothetical protein
MTPSRRLAALSLALVSAAEGFFLWQGASLIHCYSPTYDEGAYLAAGFSCWTSGDFRLNRDHPPLAKLLLTLPILLTEPELAAMGRELPQHGNHWQASQWFFANSPVPRERLFAKARAANLALGGLLLAIIAWWAHRLWGGLAAALAAWLTALDPSIQAHSSLVTFDTALALFTTLTFYCFWEFTRRPSRWWLMAIGLSLGASLAVKHSAILNVALLIAAIVAQLIAGRDFCVPNPSNSGKSSASERWRAAVTSLCGIVAAAIVVIVGAYFFVEAAAWPRGLKEQLSRAGGKNITYLNGVTTPHGTWRYYPEVFALKTPIGSMLAILVALLGSLGKPRWWNDVWPLLLPAVGYFAGMMYSNVDLGVRLILPVYPFLYVLASRLTASPPLIDWRWHPGCVAAATALVLTAVSVMRLAPQQLAYFNEFAGGPAYGRHWLADSNLDWGQDLRSLKQEMDRRHVPIVYLSYYGTYEPEWYGLRYQFLPGYGRISDSPPSTERVPADAPQKLAAISVNNLLGLYLENPDLYAWLRNRHPSFRVGYSILVYDVTDDPEAIRRLEEASGS